MTAGVSLLQRETLQKAPYAPLAATYSAAAIYKTGQLAVQGGVLYQANQNLGPEAFTTGHWTAVGGSSVAANAYARANYR